MCYNGKCLHCIPVEYGSLALGIISTIGSGLALLWSIIEGIIIAIGMSNPDTSNVPDDHEGYKTIFKAFFEGFILLGLVVFVIIVVVGSLIALIFSVLLLIGILNRRPVKVLAYFVYGAVVVVLSASASVCFLCDGPEYFLPGVIGLSACGIYSLCLVMVYKTYIKLQQEAMFENHIPLVENHKLDP